jgi:hypothetical protein
MRCAWIIFAALLPGSALAGAWTLPRGHLQLISGTIYANADHAFDNRGSASLPVTYDKVLTQAYVQYGITDWLTAFLDPEYAVARSGPAGGHISVARDAAIAGGARVRITDAIGLVSLEASVKSAGAFNLSVSANSVVSGRQAELRALYGMNFPLLGRFAFFDVEVAHRWVSGGRPDEVPIDLTLGWHASPKLMFMAQSFNIVSGGARPPYGYYRSHKLQFSAIYDFSARYSLQAGAFFSPAGQNSLEERGLELSLWTSF